MSESDFEPENQTICPNTQGSHVWVWDEDQDDWRCDECGVLHDRQED